MLMGIEHKYGGTSHTIVVCVGNRTQGVHRHRHAKTGHKPERDTGSIILNQAPPKTSCSQGMGQILGILVKSRMDLTE